MSKAPGTEYLLSSSQASEPIFSGDCTDHRRPCLNPRELIQGERVISFYFNYNALAPPSGKVRQKRSCSCAKFTLSRIAVSVTGAIVILRSADVRTGIPCPSHPEWNERNALVFGKILQTEEERGKKRSSPRGEKEKKILPSNARRVKIRVSSLRRNFARDVLL